LSEFGGNTPAAARWEDDEVTEICQYNLKHKMHGVLAVTTIDCGPVGIVPACQWCADFYERQGR
jgi:hypothetical protein